ncbi:MAG: hypothetical protein AB1640_22965 [bacterium]
MQEAAERYGKWVYWLDPAAQRGLIDELLRDKRRVHLARHQPCEALYGRREIVAVAPEVWDKQCLRQGSWYRASPRKGSFLVAANRPLEGLDLDPWGTIRLEAFSPARLASDEDVIGMLEDERAAQVLPEGWGLFTPWEIRALEIYSRQERTGRTLEELFCYYSANHLNFVFARFSTPCDGRGPAPYSIQKTPLVCSACVELFGILGEAFRVKYVAPCPGLKYVKPAPGEYFRVDSAG